MPKQNCLVPCSNESQGGTEGIPGDILILATARSTHEWKMSPHAKPGHVTLGLIRYLLMTLIRYALWANWSVCCFCPLERRAGRAAETALGSTGWSKSSDFIVPLNGSHVQLLASLSICHRFTANKDLLRSTLHCKDMDVWYFSLEEDGQTGSTVEENLSKKPMDTGQCWKGQYIRI